MNSFVENRNSSDNLSNAINWSHIDGLFDIIRTIGKQTLIEIDENVNSFISKSRRKKNQFDFILIDLLPLRTACLSCLASFLIGQQLLVCIHHLKSNHFKNLFI